MRTPRPDRKEQVDRNVLTLMVSLGHELTLVQRIAYTLIGLFTMAFGLSLLFVAAEDWREGTPSGVAVWLIVGTLVTGVAAATLRNVLCFPKSADPD